MEELAPILNMSISRCTMSEIATIFAAYTESRVAFPRLFRNIRKSLNQRVSEITPKTAVSLMYSFSRVSKHKKAEDEPVINDIMKIAFAASESLSSMDCLHLLTACNAFGIFPRESIDKLIMKIQPYIGQLNDDQSFVVLCTIVKSG